jgi:hypothetical protein
MPEEVLTAMLKQLETRRRVEDEERRLLALSQFREARPSIERRLTALKDCEPSMEPGAYLLELSKICFDLFELGGRRSARSALCSRYLKDLQNVPLNDRIRIGLKLLELLVDDGQDLEAAQLIEKLSPSVNTLPEDDDRKWQYTKLEIRALIAACAYDNARVAIKAARKWAPDKETTSLTADLVEMELLQGDFGQDDET